jgi:hypothetical protein
MGVHDMRKVLKSGRKKNVDSEATLKKRAIAKSKRGSKKVRKVVVKKGVMLKIKDIKLVDSCGRIYYRTKKVKPRDSQKTITDYC